ncbi:hypothetical protein IT398_02870 [Candidatus Nomurabacteria bacterium]|nr:hypothetical protein [Candidatus Nomurabacteria bacterium]
MKIVTVIPITRGIFRDNLTYFSAQEIAVGDLVSVPVRQKMTAALVVKIDSLTEAKTSLKKADFSIKKINQIKTRQFLSPELVETANELADYFAAPIGQILKSLLPKIIFEKQKSLGNTIKKMTREISGEKLVIQDTDEERLSYYRGLIRESFARNQSVFVCEPTLSDLLASAPSLEKGIEHYTVRLHSKLGAKNLRENWTKALTEDHPLLVIATPPFLSLTRNDLGLVILDRENSANYHTLSRPFVDYRIFVEKLTSKRGQKLLVGDILLRPETMWRTERNELVPVRTPKQRLTDNVKMKLVSVSGDVIWCEETKDLIEKTAKEKIFLLANRRGVAPIIVCDDCGEAVLCGNCESPLVLHKENVFRCHHCGETRTAEEKCRRCQSWRLRPLGTGIERVARELKLLVPNRAIFQIDSDQTKSPKSAESVSKKFHATSGAILVGTEMALRYLDEKVTHSVVITVDSMLALPDFRINEKVFILLARLRGMTSKEMLIQTRQSENETLTEIAHGQLLEFYRREIAEREQFDYPPFKIFIKITHPGNDSTLRATFKKMEKILLKWSPATYPSLHGDELNLLIKIPPEDWPKLDLVAWLKKLPPSFKVSINPESVL